MVPRGENSSVFEYKQHANVPKHRHQGMKMGRLLPRGKTETNARNQKECSPGSSRDAQRWKTRKGYDALTSPLGRESRAGR